MTARQPAIAATNTAANDRLLSCISNPHGKTGILPPRCKVRHRSFRALCPRTRPGARPNEVPGVVPVLGLPKPDPGAGYERRVWYAQDKNFPLTPAKTGVQGSLILTQ